MLFFLHNRNCISIWKQFLMSSPGSHHLILCFYVLDTHTHTHTHTHILYMPHLYFCDYFISLSMFSILVHATISKISSFFNDWVIFYCMCIPHFLSFFLYSCAGWGYIVAFKQVLTMYQIYHTWIYHSHPLPFSFIRPPLTPEIVSIPFLYPFILLFQMLVIMKNGGTRHRYLFKDLISTVFVYFLWRGIAELCSSVSLNFSGILIIFYRVVSSYIKCIGISISPHFHPHLYIFW
jgi:hypothetical protein